MSHNNIANTSTVENYSSFSTFLENFKTTIRAMYRDEAGQHILTLPRGVPPTVFSKLMPLNPLSVCIPSEQGGRGGNMKEIIAMVSAASYESLPLALTLGINSALFIQPTAKYARKEVKDAVFARFLNHERHMGGLMITEPDFGSDALNMQTYCEELENSYRLKGTKHWAGLTGSANFWLLTAREKTPSGQLKRDMDFFLCDRSQSNQQIIVEEYFDNLGLHQIPYGRNIIDVEIPKSHKLIPTSNGINLLLDLLHRSRFQFPAMGLGFVQRMLDEAVEHCNARLVGGKSLASYDQVQFRLVRLQASCTIMSAMNVYSSEHGGLEFDLHNEGLVANAIKTVTTDLMQEAAQSLVQLIGAKAYKNSNIAGRGIVDSRPFQIFEGSNDILYIQISETVIKQMKQRSCENLYEYFATNHLTNKVAERLKSVLQFELVFPISQRKTTDLGQALARIISMQIVMSLADKQFNAELIEQAITQLHREINGIISCYTTVDSSRYINSNEPLNIWFNFVE